MLATTNDRNKWSYGIESTFDVYNWIRIDSTQMCYYDIIHVDELCWLICGLYVCIFLVYHLQCLIHEVAARFIEFQYKNYGKRIIHTRNVTVLEVSYNCSKLIHFLKQYLTFVNICIKQLLYHYYRYPFFSLLKIPNNSSLRKIGKIPYVGSSSIWICYCAVSICNQ